MLVKKQVAWVVDETMTTRRRMSLGERMMSLIAGAFAMLVCGAGTLASLVGSPEALEDMGGLPWMAIFFLSGASGVWMGLGFMPRAKRARRDKVNA